MKQKCTLVSHCAVWNSCRCKLAVSLFCICAAWWHDTAGTIGMKCRSVLVGRMLVGNKRYVPHCCAISRAFKRAREWGKSEIQRRGLECSELVLVVHSVPSYASNVTGSCLREIPNTREACASAGNPTWLRHLSLAFLSFFSPLFLAEFDVCYSVLTTSRHISCISYLWPPLKNKSWIWRARRVSLACLLENPVVRVRS